jgi:hypothetical protein
LGIPQTSHFEVCPVSTNREPSISGSRATDAFDLKILAFMACLAII